MLFFSNKVVVVTGGSDGIGKALVESLLALGAKVATCARQYEKLYALQSANPTKLLHISTTDVSSESDCKNFLDSVINTFGTVDILINNAGISMRALFEDTDLLTIRKLMDINFWGTVYCTKFCLDEVIKNKGTIVGVTSIAGFRGLPGRTGYSASKFAVIGFLESLRAELQHKQVNVLWVAPGFTASNIRNVALDKDSNPQKENPMDENKMMSAEECASHILRAIEHNKRTLVLTAMGKVIVILNKLFPVLSDKLIRKFYFKDGILVK